MTNSTGRHGVVGVGAALLALAACSTQEIGRATPDARVVIRGQMETGDGIVSIAFPPTEGDFEAQEARAATSSAIPYHVFFDGGQMITLENSGPMVNSPVPVTVLESGSVDLGYLSFGHHRFQIAAAGGGRTVFAGDVEIPRGSINRLFLVGRPAALEGRFVSYPAAPPAGMLHVTLTNLVRGETRLEVVSCPPAEPCAPLSPPLAYGETFSADFPAGDTEETRLSLAGGAAIGYRQVPTASLPAPPLLTLGLTPVWDLETSSQIPSGNLVAAPVYMTAEGQIISTF